MDYPNVSLTFSFTAEKELGVEPSRRITDEV